VVIFRRRLNYWRRKFNFFWICNDNYWSLQKIKYCGNSFISCGYLLLSSSSNYEGGERRMARWWQGRYLRVANIRCCTCSRFEFWKKNNLIIKRWLTIGVSTHRSVSHKKKNLIKRWPTIGQSRHDSSSHGSSNCSKDKLGEKNTKMKIMSRW
jgi:hypothetical protein